MTSEFYNEWRRPEGLSELLYRVVMRAVEGLTELDGWVLLSLLGGPWPKKMNDIHYDVHDVSYRSIGGSLTRMVKKGQVLRVRQGRYMIAPEFLQSIFALSSARYMRRVRR